MPKAFFCSIEDDFIPLLADFIEDEFIKKNKDISRLAIVFGGKRPALFLRKELAHRIGQSFFPPHFFSIDEFVEYSLDKKKSFSAVSDLEACFDIYKLAGRISPEILTGRKEFSQFLPWAREILSFIEQLDLENISDDKLRNIQAKAQIGYDVPESINLMLGQVISLRQAFHKQLAKSGKTTRGLSYLEVAREIDNLKFAEFEQIIFCGFFYLHKTEEEIIKVLHDKENAVLFFQGVAEGWSVLDKLKEKFKFEEYAPKKKNTLPQIFIQEGFDLHSQACLARQIIKDKKDLSDTAIVLPATDTLIPLLSELSPHIKDFNVSMGYPLKRSSLYSIFTDIFAAQESRKEDKYYSRDYLKALAHPLVKNLRIFSNPSLTRILVHKIEEVLLGMEDTSLGGSLFIKLGDIENLRPLYDAALKTVKNMGFEVSWEELKEAVRQLHKFLFLLWEDLRTFKDFSQSLGELMEFLLERSFLSSYPLNLRMAERILEINEELGKSSFCNEQFKEGEIYKIFNNKMVSEMISFSGSPLKGLQILGLFETRSLNFKRVIFLDANESILPKLKIYEPLIPREVMISLGLNRLEKEEEIQRYQFRRLVLSAKEVYIIYEHSDERERSRFVEEIIWQEQKKQLALDVFSIPQGVFALTSAPDKLSFAKNEKMVEYLKKRQYSASSINTYLNCPLSFYYKYVLGLEEKEDFLDELGGRDIGTFVHELLHSAFNKFVGHRPQIDKDFRKEFFSLFEEKFVSDFENKMKSDAFLVKEVLKFRLERFLDNEAKSDTSKIICLEKEFTGDIDLRCGRFSFKAIIDRIDLLNDGSTVILDYKTGGADILPVTDSEQIIQKGFARVGLKSTIKSFQLPLYLCLVRQSGEYSGSKINAMLYFIREVKKSPLLRKNEDFENIEILIPTYLKALESVLSEIIDQDVPFVPDESNPRYCQICPFGCLCR